MSPSQAATLLGQPAWAIHGIGRMQATNVACPSCQGVATFTDAAPLGKSVSCPTCGKPFTVTAEAVRCASPSNARPNAAAAPTTPWWIEAAQQPIEVPAIPVDALAQPPAAAPVP